MEQTTTYRKLKDVLVTSDYGMFKKIDGNRLVNQLHVDRLAESMKEKQLVTPVIVNENYEIIDGQHRFTACETHGLPVYYIICEGYGLADVHRLNEKSHDWNLKDFLEGYATFATTNPKYQDYVLLKEFIQANKITASMGIFLTKGEQNEQDATTSFKNGYYQAVEMDLAQVFLNQLEDFALHFQERYKSAVFMKAFKLFSSSPKYNHENMVKKLEYMSGYLQNRSTKSQYLEILSEVYNTRVNERNRIYFRGEKEIA